jgi:very-short-patch-repair endonuclease/predicted transcriptional regulator of viral defense system
VTTHADLLVARRAAEQWGVVSLDDLRARGLSREAVAVRVRKGLLHPMHRGVYAVGHANPPLEGRFLAAVMACAPDAVLSHFSAAALWGIVPWDHRHPEVSVAASVRRRHPGLRVHRSSMLAVRDVMRHRGIPLTSPARTLLDLAATLPERPLRRAARHAQALHRVNVRQLAEVLDRAGRRPGTAVLRRIIATGPAPTRSELENVVLDLILRAGMQSPEVNVPLILDGRRVIPDFRWPGQHLVLEADGAAWHDGPIAKHEDAERQALLERNGERVVRVTWHQAITQPDHTLARLRVAGAPHATPPRAAHRFLATVQQGSVMLRTDADPDRRGRATSRQRHRPRAAS